MKFPIHIRNQNLLHLLFQWEVYIDGRLQGDFHLARNKTVDEALEKEKEEEDVLTMKNTCHINVMESMYSNITVAHLQVAKADDNSVLINCTAQIDEELYYSVADVTETNELCKDQHTVIYVNESADYLDLISLCRKVRGTVLKQGDLEEYNENIKSIKKTCQTDGILTWLHTDNKHDFNSWCTVLLINGSFETRPCHEPLSCNLCKIKAALQVTIFGELEEYDKNFTVRTTNEGELYMQGHENSFVNEINDNWVIRSNMIKFKCYNNETALPFVRLMWMCDDNQKLLAFSTCTLDDFACDDGECRPETERCDGVMDCFRWE